MKNENKSTMWQALSLAGQLGYTIAIPLVILALVGRFFDEKYKTSPWLLLVGILISLVITSIWIYKESITIMKDMDKEIKKTNENLAKIAENNEKINNNS